MQEFSSISVSSYEAGSLADRLTEQARDGWDVVAIVPTGSVVTAYLCRAASESAPDADGESPATTDDDTPTDSAPAAESSPASEASNWAALADESTPSAEPEPEPEPSAPAISIPEVSIPEASPYVPEPSVAHTDPVESAPEHIEPVDEPAGWAIAPESANEQPAAEPASEPAPEPAADLGYGSASIAAAADEVAAASSSDTAATTTAVPEQPVQPAVVNAAPAGWYADPSSRFELRYWDGTQWTEHVSRGGQQFTDPPVA